MNQHTKSHRLNLILLIFILAFVFLFFLCYLFPYTGDDWAWGGSLGLKRLNNFFKDYNGRYLGNLLVLALTRSNLLKTLVMSTTLFGISLFAYLISGKNRSEAFAVFFFVLLAMPRLIFRQAVVWTSGFSNYAIPVLSLFAYLYLIKNVAENKDLVYKKQHIPFAVLLGLSGALFIEHLTLYQIAAGAFIVGYTLLTKKKAYAVHIGFLVGSLFGAILMFSNGAYKNIAQHSNSYQKIPSSLADSFDNAFKAIVGVVCKHVMFENHILNVILTVFIVLLTLSFLCENPKIGMFKKLAVHLCAAVCISYPLYSLLTIIYNGWKIFSDNTAIFEALYTSITFLSLFLLTFLCVADKVRKRRMLFELSSVPALSFPLLFVHPIGGRCFFITYIFFSLYLTELIVYLLVKKNSRMLCIYVARVFLTLCICFAVYYISIFAKIAKEDNERTDFILEQIVEGKEVVLVPNLVYNGYLWTSLPEKGSVWEWRYKDFHGIDQDIAFENITNGKWQEIKTTKAKSLS